MKTNITVGIIFLSLSMLSFSCSSIDPPNLLCISGDSNCTEEPEVIERCKSEGTNWEEFQICPEGTSCVEGMCLDAQCSKGQTECGPVSLLECNDDGQWESIACPDGHPCFRGECIECLKNDACNDGEICIDGSCQHIKPEITTSELPSGVVGTPYRAVLESSGGSLPLKWNISEGELPEGIEFTQGGILSGTPQNAEIKDFTVTLEDYSGENFSRSFSLQVYVDGPVLITSNSIKSAKEGSSYSFELKAAGGSTPYAWQILDGSLPSGLTLSSSGTLSGMPEEIGAFPLQLRVVDGSSPPTYDSKEFMIDVRVSPLEIVGGQEFNLLIFKVIILNPLIPIIPYSVNLKARGGVRPYTWAKVAPPSELSWIIPEWDLPNGLKMNNSGRISGVVMDNATANTISIPGGPNISGYFFMGKVTDSRSPSKSSKAIFCIPTIAF